MTQRLLDNIRWTWAGPVLIVVILGMVGAWAVNVDGRVKRLEDALVMTARETEGVKGALETIKNQNLAQDNRMNDVTGLLRTLVEQHMAAGKGR